MELRDPLYGGVRLSDGEARVTLHPLAQRLHGVRQLGFRYLSYPGATHSRFLHSVGTMELAGRALDAVVGRGPGRGPGSALRVTSAEHARLRALVRMAGLLHDIGHPPFSPVTQGALPSVGALAISGYGRPGDIPATNTDVAVSLVLDDFLGESVDAALAAEGWDRSHVACLLSSHVPSDAAPFRVGGADIRPLLRQLISSELAANRMDYLMRDAYFCGVAYGSFDRERLLSELSAVEVGGRWHLAIERSAVLGFEKLLLARHRMFAAVYFHHRAVCYDHLLVEWLRSEERYRFETAPRAFAHETDGRVEAALLASNHPAAAAIVARDIPQLLLELDGEEEASLRGGLDARLRGAGIEPLWITSENVLSAYRRQVAVEGEDARLFVRQASVPGLPAVTPLEDSTDLFRKYAGGTRTARLYVPAGEVAAGRAAIGIEASV